MYYPKVKKALLVFSKDTMNNKSLSKENVLNKNEKVKNHTASLYFSHRKIKTQIYN